VSAMGTNAFAAFLAARGLRMTRERGAILAEVLARGDHFSPEDLHDALKRRGAAVSLASVYRTLPLLADAGIIAAAERTAKLTRWERAAGRGHHDHMRCACCGKAIEFYSAELERLQERLCRAHRFTSLRHTLQIHGICRACARAARRRGEAVSSAPDGASPSA